MRDDFAVFILSHGRANNVKTYNALKKCGYTGKVFILVDNEDVQQAEYQKRYGDQVIVFDKQKAAEITDAGDNFAKRNSVIYARNWNFVVAKAIGLKFFWQLDDDYSDFGYSINPAGDYLTGPERSTKSLDSVLDACIDFLTESGAHSMAFAQGGDFMGGAESNPVKMARQGNFMRKLMNSFLFCVERPISFVGRMNDDVNTYVTRGMRGELFVTTPKLRLWQAETQAQSGGLTEMYLDAGTYVKSFYTVIYAPSCTTLGEMGRTNKRIHHRISWRNAAPKIVDEKYRKARHA
jgi:hypothetical protein